MKKLRQFVAVGLLLGSYNAGLAQNNSVPSFRTEAEKVAWKATHPKEVKVGKRAANPTPFQNLERYSSEGAKIEALGLNSLNGSNPSAFGILPPPDNDDCANAQMLFCGDVVAGTTLGAAEEVVPTTNAGTTGAGVWYYFYGTGLNVTFSNCSANTDPNFDSEINVFTGSCGVFTVVDGNDDDANCAQGLQSTVTIATALNELYYVYVSDYATGGFGGYFELSVSCERSVNADCSNAIPLSCGSVFSGNTLGASQEVIPTFNGFGTGAGVWYTFVGTGGNVDFSTCSGITDFDSEINVLTGSCGSWVNVGGNDDDFSCGVDGSFSTATVATSYGELYYVYVSDWTPGGNGGNFQVTATCSAPQNDLCADATPLSCGDYVEGSTELAGVDGPLTTCAGDGFTYAADVWYTIVGNGQDLTASLCLSLYDTKIDIYEGGCGVLTCVAFDDDFCAPGSEVTWTSTQGTEYLIRVHGYGGEVGQYGLGVTCVCGAYAGTLLATNSTEVLESGSATISAVENDAPVVPAGYSVAYVLTSGPGLVIVDLAGTPSFTVTAAGDYTIHTLVYNSADQGPLLAAATGIEVNALLIQGGGSICGSLDVTGAAVTVEDVAVGISSALNRSLSVYPNPNNGQFVVQLKGEGNASLNILDMMGRRVYTQAMTLNGTFRQAISLDVAKGTYVLQVVTNNGIATRKVELN